MNLIAYRLRSWVCMWCLGASLVVSLLWKRGLGIVWVIGVRCVMSWALKLADFCKVTGRRHRVSRCRSAYFASPWRLLTFNLRRRRREAALLFPESWWHLTMRCSRTSLFMIIPNTKRHPNNTKTDQLPISEVLPAFQGRTITRQ